MSSEYLAIGSLQEVLSNVQTVGVDDIAAFTLIAILLAGYILRGVIWDKPDPYRDLWFKKPQEADAETRRQETRDIARKLEEIVSGHQHLIPHGSLALANLFALTEQRYRDLLGLTVRHS